MQVNGPLEPKKNDNETSLDISDSELEEKTEECFISALKTLLETRKQKSSKSLKNRITEKFTSADIEKSSNFLSSLFNKKFTRGMDLFKNSVLSINDNTYLMSEFYPAKAPSISVIKNPFSARLWVKAHTEEFREIAQKLINNIDHIRHDDFLTALENSVEDFNEYLDSQQDKSYVIVIPGDFKKSALWVTSLAADFLKYPPSKIIMKNDPNYEEFMEKSNSKNVVLFDDASYSGNQMAGYINTIGELSADSKVHVIIPFMTNYANTFIKENVTKVDYKISSHKIMKSFSESLDDKEIKLLQEKGAEIFHSDDISNLTLTYFDHKKADDLSLVPSVDDGSFLCEVKQKPILFVGKVISPYKS
jgi:hypothetical protein